MGHSSLKMKTRLPCLWTTASTTSIARVVMRSNSTLATAHPMPILTRWHVCERCGTRTYALVAVLGVEPGVGCHVRNLFTEETRLLVDIGLSKTARPGAVIATRLLDFGGYIATGGAALPLGVLDNDELDQWQRKLRAGVDDDRSDPAPLIRSCLQRGASSNIRYEGMNTQRRSDVEGGSPPVEDSAQRRLALAKRHASKAVTNRRCRCGSGKMFKNCCGKR